MKWAVNKQKGNGQNELSINSQLWEKLKKGHTMTTWISF